jgi:TadE-like protein
VIGAILARRRERGQGIVEFALVLPIFMMLLLIILEFGLAFNHSLTVGLATREGARVGAALATGGVTDCTDTQTINVDQQIIAGLQRILKSPGSDVVMSHIAQVRIYKATVTGAEVGPVNIWTYAGPGLGPTADPGPPADKLDFTQQSVGWKACDRNNGANPDSIGVAVRYNYALQTPLGSFMNAMHGSTPNPIAMNERTVMVLQPTN